MSTQNNKSWNNKKNLEKITYAEIPSQ